MTTLLPRMADDYLAHTIEEDSGRDADDTPPAWGLTAAAEVGGAGRARGGPSPLPSSNIQRQVIGATTVPPTRRARGAARNEEGRS